MDNIADFTLQLGKIAQVLDIRVDIVKKKVAFDLFGQIVKRTPVDTGRARASWNVSIGQPDPSVAPPREKTKNNEGKKLKHGDQVTTAESIQPTVSVMASQLTDPIYITNNLDYIEFLDAGSSKQAPAGMVMLSVQAILAEIEIIIAQASTQNTDLPQ